MDLRTRIQSATREAMKARDSARTSTLRLIGAAIKDREIALRGDSGTDAALAETDIIEILSRMVKQRHESVRAYEEAGRLELAEKEGKEIAVIQSFLPRQLDEAEVANAIKAAIADTNATGLRDMGRVMGKLREHYAGQMDFGTVGPRVKAALME